MGFPSARSVVDGLRLVLGAFRVEGADADNPVHARSVEVPVRELVGRVGVVRFAPIDSDDGSGADGGIVMTSSPRSEAVWSIVVAVLAIPMAIASILAIISGSGSAPTWFLAAWAMGWMLFVGNRLAAQGRALHAVLADLSAAPNGGAGLLDSTTARCSTGKTPLKYSTVEASD